MQPASWSLCFFLADQTQTTLRSAKFTKTRENITILAYLLFAFCLPWLAPGLLCMACVLLPFGRFLHRRGVFCTSVLLCLACSWLAQLGLCCLGLACCARAAAKTSFMFYRTARGVRTFPDKSSAPRPVFAQLPLQFTANLKRHPCNLQVKMDVV